jgi:hypothetical protein
MKFKAIQLYVEEIGKKSYNPGIKIHGISEIFLI